DGATDDSPTGGPDACPLQKGVCAGSREKCKGASGWACDAAGYKAHAAAYEATEKTCDGKDNDCDGQTDEGLLNACGKCGAVPKESCNGKDDDCNGKTDDTAACAACGASEVELAKVDSGWGYQMAWKNSMALLGDEAFVFLNQRGNYSYTNLFRLADGQLAASPSVSVSVVGNPHIAPGDGFLHLAVTGYNSGSASWQHMYYYRLSPSGQVLTQVEVDENSSNYSGAPSPVAQGGSTVGLVYWPASGSPQYATIGYDGQAAEVWGPVAGSNDYGVQLGIRKDGTAFVGTKYGSFEGPVYVEQVDGETWTVDSGKGGSPHLRVAPDDTVWVVWESGASYDYDGMIKAWRLTKGGSEQGPEDIGTGKSPVIAFDPAGRPVVARLQGGTIVASTKSGSTWTDETVWQPQGGETGGGPAGLEFDSAGRMHLEYHVYTPGSWNQYHAIRYRLICPSGGGTCTPDCTGKTCGDDGCGGSCGTCPDGCGAAPSATCAGKCGKFEPDAACKCNSACVDYGDCCPDYADCCA
ncbi:MAG: hypothetical protein FJ087_13500, partial [Deltaproteobacteria bacterium]|nr:hypothetical protein [Deltaproteobacteria bacterium]